MQRFMEFGLGLVMIMVAGPANAEPAQEKTFPPVTVTVGKCELQRSTGVNFNPLLGPWIPAVRIDLNWKHSVKRGRASSKAPNDRYAFTLQPAAHSEGNSQVLYYSVHEVGRSKSVVVNLSEERTVMWAPCEGVHEIKTYDASRPWGGNGNIPPLQSFSIDLSNVQAAGTPSAPTELMVVPKGAIDPPWANPRWKYLKADMSWAPPLNKGTSDIIDYRIQYRAVDIPTSSQYNHYPRHDGSWVNIPSARSTETVLTDHIGGEALIKRWGKPPICSPDHHYQFRVAAVNRQGLGEFSAPFELRGGNSCDVTGEADPPIPSPENPNSYEMCSFRLTYYESFSPFAAGRGGVKKFFEKNPKHRMRRFNLPHGAKDIEVVDISVEEGPDGFFGGAHSTTGPRYPGRCKPTVSRWLGHPKQKIRSGSRGSMGWENYENYLRTLKLNSRQGPNQVVPIAMGIYTDFNGSRGQCPFELMHRIIVSGVFKGLRACNYLKPDQVWSWARGVRRVEIFNSKGQEVSWY